MGTFLYFRTHIADPNQFIARTGLGIKDINIAKNCIQWPFQKIAYIDMKPISYKFTLRAMTSEMIEFDLPVVFTIGPEDKIESLEKYSKFLLDVKNDKEIGNINREILIKGIIEGETRVYAAGMTARQIFDDRDAFKNKVTYKIQEQLKQYGLLINNANIQELADVGESKYFYNMRQKALCDAEANAVVAIAAARANSNIGQKEKETETRQKLANLEAQSLIAEKHRQTETRQKTAEFETSAMNAEKQRNTEMRQKQAEYEATAKISEKEQDTQTRQEIARLEATAIEIENKNNEKIAQYKAELGKVEAQSAKISSIKAVEKLQAELQKEVEQKNFEQEKEKLRALELSRTIVVAEKLVKEVKEAEGKAKSIELIADAHKYSEQMKYDAILYGKHKESEAIKAIYQAQSEGLANVRESLGNDPNTLIQYFMIKDHVYENIAKENAVALNNLKPNINWWNQGTNSDTNPISSLTNSIPSLLMSVHNQTGLKPADWLVQGFKDTPIKQV